MRGYDAGKKIMGRKRHILVDTLGLILAVVVHRAHVLRVGTNVAPKSGRDAATTTMRRTASGPAVKPSSTKSVRSQR